MFTILSLYIICFIFCIAIEKARTPSRQGPLIFLCLLYLSLVSGTRLVGGSDFATYEGHYMALSTFPDVLNPDNVNKHYEIGYTYIASFFKTIGLSFYGFCLIHACFFYFCLWKGIRRYTSHFGIVILIFLYKLFFYNTMISMRQSLTIALFFLTLPLIEEKKWIKYYVSTFFISTIHNGALLLFLIYPLIYMPMSKNIVRLLNFIFIPTFFIGMAGIDVLEPIGRFLQSNATSDVMSNKAASYFESENLSPIDIFHTLEYFVIMICFYSGIKRFDFHDPKVKLSAIMFLCLLPLFTLLRGSEILTREKDYFTIFYAVIIGMLIDRFPRRKLEYYVFVTVLCAYGYYRFVNLFDRGAFLDYHSWLFNPYYSFFNI